MRDCFFCFWDKFVDVCLLRLGVFFFLCFLSGGRVCEMLLFSNCR